MTTIDVTTISVRELKTNASSYLRNLRQNPNLEIIITKHGKPCAKLVAFGEATAATSGAETIGLRDTWTHMAALTEVDFYEAKGIWEPKNDV
jgi:prevent-host-death family protein